MERDSQLEKEHKIIWKDSFGKRPQDFDSFSIDNLFGARLPYKD